MHIWMELHMWENRYRQFKDQYWNCTCGKRGSNQKVELHMWENVSPYHVGTIAYFLRSNVFETPMASLSSVGKSHYEVQQSFFLPSPLLY